MGNDIFPRGNHIVGIMGAMVSALLCAASASGATIKWTGGGDGTTWGTAVFLCAAMAASGAFAR